MHDHSIDCAPHELPDMLEPNNRDVKGANILITRAGVVKLADFGVATLQRPDKTHSVVGTPNWSLVLWFSVARSLDV